MNDEPINEGVAESGETFVKDHGFAAVPIHFKPAEGAEKKIALVIPGVEPPLAFFRLTGDSPENLTFEEIDGHVDSVSQGSDGEDSVEDTSSQTLEEQDQPIETPQSEEKSDEEEVEEPDPAIAGEETDISYPHEDSAGNPVAGFLIGNEDAQPLVILVRPEEGESTEDAMQRVSEAHPEHIPGSLEEATKTLGHSPLSKDS